MEELSKNDELFVAIPTNMIKEQLMRRIGDKSISYTGDFKLLKSRIDL